MSPDPSARAAPTDPVRSRVLRRGWTDAESWRGTSLGLWAWLIQRVAAVALVVTVAVHLSNPFRRSVQALLLSLVLIHGLLGLRALLLDTGVPVRWHRALFGAAWIFAAAIFALVWLWRWY